MMSTRTSYDKSEIFVLYGLLIGHQLVAFSVESSMQPWDEERPVTLLASAEARDNFSALSIDF
jgi:hypothetical protein